MTLLEMQTYFQALLAETTTSSDFVASAIMTDFINEGCLIFAQETKIVRAATLYQSVTLSTGISAYALDAVFLTIKEGVFLFDASGNYIKEISPKEGGFREFIVADSDSGEPTNYAIAGITKAALTSSPQLNINFNPPPSATYDNYIARVYYAKQPITLSGATDVSDIPIQYHRGSVCIGVALFKEIDQEFDQAKYFWTKADYWIKRAKKDLYAWDKTLVGWRFAEGQYVDR